MSNPESSGDRGRERSEEVTLRSFDALALYLDRARAHEGAAGAGGHLFGAVYLLPDRETHFGRGDVHPWVVVESAAPGQPRVTLCPRTTTDVHRRGPIYVPSPAGVLARLERDGLILLKFRHRLHPDQLGGFDYVGLLPEACRERLRKALDAFGNRVVQWSGEVE